MFTPTIIVLHLLVLSQLISSKHMCVGVGVGVCIEDSLYTTILY